MQITTLNGEHDVTIATRFHDVIGRRTTSVSATSSGDATNYGSTTSGYRLVETLRRGAAIRQNAPLTVLTSRRSALT
jgi:hypothetical protein